MTTFIANPEQQYIKLSKVSISHGLSPGSVLRLQEADPTFPRLVVLSPKCKLINVTELNDWLKAQEANPKDSAIRRRSADHRGEQYLTKAKAKVAA